MEKKNVFGNRCTHIYEGKKSIKEAFQISEKKGSKNAGRTTHYL